MIVHIIRRRCAACLIVTESLVHCCMHGCCRLCVRVSSKKKGKKREIVTCQKQPLRAVWCKTRLLNRGSQFDQPGDLFGGAIPEQGLC